MLRAAVLITCLIVGGAGIAAQVPATSNRPVEELYKQNCQACHMPDGNAALEAMNFADGKWKHGTSSREMAKIIADGVPGTAMMPFKARFSEQEMLALAKYVRTFDKKLKPEAGAARARKK